jgi:glycosyltransferase involved in cell wall biosynthesis
LQPTKDEFSLPDSFVLFVGSIEPRKNLLTLLKAYADLPLQQKQSNPLVLVGFKGWQNQEIMSIIDSQQEFINYLGYVSDEQLPHIYNLATLFVYPSYYEGFGIPPIEAFACGTPTIVSNITSLPEVCGDCAIYIDPYNQQQLTNELNSILNNKTLQQKLIQKALVKVQQYSWDLSAKKHQELFEKLLQQL